MGAPRRHVHPYQKTATRQIVVGSMLLAAGALPLLVSGALGVLGVALALFGGFLVWVGTRSRRQADAILLNNEAVDLLSRGRIAEAEALLDAVRMTSGNVRRAVGLQRASIALRLADAAGAERHADAVLGTPLGLVTRDAERSQNVVARAIRALARASMGKEREALDDVEAVRADEAATPEALARAAVAEAVVLTKRDDRDGLARCLRAATPLLDSVAPRERALLRAVRRMLEVKTRSVYREPGRTADPAREEPLLEEWVSKVVPQAAPFVEEAERHTRTSSLETASMVSGPAQSGSKEIERRTPDRTKRSKLAWVVGWIVTVIAILALLQRLSPGETAGEAASDSTSLVAYLGVGAIALVVVRIGRDMARAKAGMSALRRAMRTLAAGDTRSCEQQLAALLRRDDDTIAATAQLQLGVLAERRCAMTEALARCDAGLERVSRRPYVRALNSDVLVPELIAQRAFVLAAMGREAEADAELATLAREHPTFAFLTRSMLRVRMVQALRRRDVEAAVRLARERTPELPLNRRDELLADIVLALSGGQVAEGEVERLLSELAEDSELAAWIDFMAPDARTRLAERSRSRVRVDLPLPSDVYDAEEEDAATPGPERAGSARA